MPSKITTARMGTKKGKFEILVSEDSALAFRNRKIPWRNDILVVDQVFKDQKKGLKASVSEIKEAFGTTDPYEIAKKVLAQGDILLSAETIRKLTEEKRRQISSLISKTTTDPKTNTPIPQVRVEQAISQVSISIDPFKDADEQLKYVITAIGPVLPLRIKEALIEIQFSARAAPSGLKVAEGLGGIRGRVDDRDGNITLTLALPEALRSTVSEKLSRKFGDNVKITFK